MTTASVARNLAQSVREFENDPQMFLSYNDDRTGYIMILSNHDSRYGVMPFVFHFKLGEQYPEKPPKTEYISVDKSRIHPNLYVTGHVCLSILGTWSGPGWESSFNLYTLATHLQWIINDPYPLRWEPSFEQSEEQVLADYNRFVGGVVLKRVARKSFKVPINHTEAREYFVICLSEIMQQKKEREKAIESFHVLLENLSSSRPARTPYRERANLVVGFQDLNTLKVYIKLVARAPSIILSSSIDNIRPHFRRRFLTQTNQVTFHTSPSVTGGMSTSSTVGSSHATTSSVPLLSFHTSGNTSTVPNSQASYSMETMEFNDSSGAENASISTLSSIQDYQNQQSTNDATLLLSNIDFPEGHHEEDEDDEDPV